MGLFLNVKIYENSGEVLVKDFVLDCNSVA
jgi:hypothetical protein